MILKCLMRTWDWKTLGSEHHAAARESPGGGFVLALWHGRMLLGIPPYVGQNVAILVSGSEDGDLSQALLQAFDYRIIRGSSSRGGARALRAMLEELRGGAMVVVTPDGPRGPMHSMNPGVAWMAKATGYAVLPAGFVCDSGWRLETWDRYTIPKPWARAVLCYGKPVRLSREATQEDMDAATEEIRRRILDAEARGRELLATRDEP